jgi:uncharacterized protein YjbI with pentapeptide repeats
MEVGMPTGRRITILTVGIVVILFATIVFLPNILISMPSPTELENMNRVDQNNEIDSRLNLRNDVRASLFQGLGALFFLISVLLTIRQYGISQQQFQLSEEQLRHDRETARRDQQVTEEAQITERYTRAIELVDSPNLATRLGGIASLQQVSRQSVSYRGAVAGVLEAFVRTNAPWPPELRGQYPEGTLDLPPLRLRAADVQAAVRVLGLLWASSDATSLELSHVDVRKADLMDANLKGANFSSSNLEAADLGGADLTDAQLSEASLQGANLAGANLQGAVLKNTRLYEANVDDLTCWPEGFDLRSLGVNPGAQ